jgi:CRISPR-associated exonuclease Cas4
MFLIILGILLVAAAIFVLVQARRRQAESGLPPGRILYNDSGSGEKVEKPLYDSLLQITGKPDYLVEQQGVLIPVEVKSSSAPLSPYEGHIFQLALYCLLVERSFSKRPPYGIIRYNNRSFAIDYTPALEAELLDVLAEMRRDEKRGPLERSHEEPARCARCGYRSVCEERL